MKQPNTKRHWTALALVHYYDRDGEAARARDLYPYVQDIYDAPDHLVSALASLDKEPIVDHITVMSPGRDSTSKKTYAYYPTEEMQDQLAALGEPTHLPDGRAIPDEVDTSWPEDAFAEDAADVDPPTSDDVGLRYDKMGKGTGEQGSPRTYDSTGLREDPDFEIPTEEAEDIEDDEPAEADADEHEYVCECGEGYDDANAYAGHCGGCDVRQSDESDDDTSPGVPDVEEFDPSTTADPVGEIPTPPESTPTPGTLAGQVDWNRLATRLERKAVEAHDAGLTEVASAYSQAATLAVEGDLTARMAHILLGTPVLDLETAAPELTY